LKVSIKRDTSDFGGKNTWVKKMVLMHSSGKSLR